MMEDHDDTEGMGAVMWMLVCLLITALGFVLLVAAAAPW